MVNYILEKMTDQELKSDIDENGVTCFHFACYVANIDIIKLLLTISPSLINIRDKSGRCGLEYCLLERTQYDNSVREKTKEQILETINYLLEAGIDPNNKNTQ